MTKAEQAALEKQVKRTIKRAVTARQSEKGARRLLKAIAKEGLPK
jgi:hypothetical protein